MPPAMSADSLQKFAEAHGLAYVRTAGLPQDLDTFLGQLAGEAREDKATAPA